MRISIAVRKISSRFAAYRLRLWRKYRFSQYPLIHRRRDGGPPSPQRLLRNRGKVGVGGESCRDDDRRARNSPTDGGECVGLPQQVRAARRRVLLSLRAEKGCRDGQQVGESRRARTFPTDGGEWCSLAQLVTATDRRVLKRT